MFVRKGRKGLREDGEGKRSIQGQKDHIAVLKEKYLSSASWKFELQKCNSSSKMSPVKFWKYLLKSSYCECWHKQFWNIDTITTYLWVYSETVGAGMWDICCSNPSCGSRSVWLQLGWMSKAVAFACSPCVPGLSWSVYLINTLSTQEEGNKTDQVEELWGYQPDHW